LLYDAMHFDLMITSRAYVFEAQPASFPRRRLYQALSLPEVAHAAALYHASGRWLNDEAGVVRDVFVIGFDPSDMVFDVPEIERQRKILRLPDSVLVDASSRPELGTIQPGRQIEIEQHKVTIEGVYHLGTGFVGLGVATTSDLNFVRMFPKQSSSEVNLGLLTLKAGADPDLVAQRLRKMLPADSQVFTRDELMNHEANHWVTQTSTGLIFGFGVVVAVVVGLLILNQTLSTQIRRQLPQYATLKAIGYTDGYLGGIVVVLAMLMSTIGYVWAAVLATLVYWVLQRVTLLPIEMTAARMMMVLAIAWGMSVLSALLALRVLSRADPVDLL
jgi:putative ABC transport system permease protein